MIRRAPLDRQEKNTPPFPRRRESTTPSSVIPAKAGIHNSRARGNSTKRNTTQTDQTPHSHTEPPQRHSREGGNSTPSSVIPAKAGIHNPIIRHSREGGNPREDPTFPHRTTSTPFPRRREFPRHSREGGNPQFPRTREFNEKKHHPDRPDTTFPHRTTSTPFPRRREFHPSSVIPAKTRIPQPHHPSFPRRRESTIPAHAGIQRKETPPRPTRHHIPTQNHLNAIPAKTRIPLHHPSFPRRRESHNPIIRHSREGGNPQFPRTREFNEKKHHPDRPDTTFPHRTTSTPFPRRRESTTPIIRHSREGGNPQFPRTRE